MRTTVTLDSDVEVLLREAVRKQGRPFKQVLNDALRDAFMRKPAAKPKPYVLKTRDMGPPLIDLTHTGRVLDELDTQAYLEKQARDAKRKRR
ncbi:MAG TPA: hypothetical protein VEO95_11745 [Chthoniobacteraceae bacterium]|nr:hypothetical protein [Chthoniobacteraceae bacterium]